MQSVQMQKNVYFLEETSGATPRERWESAALTMPALVGGSQRRKADWEVYASVYDRLDGNCVPYEPSPEEKMVLRECAVRKRLAAAGVPPALQDCSFSNFDHGQEFQAKALKTSKDYVEGDVVAGFCALVGTPGTGKDHLSVSIARAFGEGALFITFDELLARIHAGYADNSADAVIERYRTCSLLVLSEVGQHGESLARDAHEILYRMLGYRYDHFLPTVLTSNLRARPDETKETTLRDFLGDRIASRVSHALVASAQMYGPDYRSTPEGRRRYQEMAHQHRQLALMENLKSVQL